jgi:hypothetical protein
MAVDINSYSPSTGRKIKEDNTIVNIADILSSIYDENSESLKTFKDVEYEDFTFQNAATQTGNGSQYTNEKYKKLTFSGKGTSSSRTFEARGIDANDNDEALQLVKNSDFSTSSNSTSNGVSYSCLVEGYKTVYVKITAISGGNETIKGRFTL